jgi:protein-tyrosine phosphatase
MLPLVDIHCHLLAGLDDGPRTDEEALAMCRLAYEEGTRLAAATAHQMGPWQDVTAERIRQAAAHLGQQLRQAGVPLTVFPSAEVRIHPGIEESWRRGELVGVGDRRHYLLAELPRDHYVDLRAILPPLRQLGVRPILAHVEKYEELLYDPGRIEALIEAGCLVQVSSASVTEPTSPREEKTLRTWLRRGIVHCLGSDGHSVAERPPRMAEAYRRIERWAGSAVADRVCSTHGMAILQGMAIRPPVPRPSRSRWLSKLW